MTGLRCSAAVVARLPAARCNVSAGCSARCGLWAAARPSRVLAPARSLVSRAAVCRRVLRCATWRRCFERRRREDERIWRREAPGRAAWRRCADVRALTFSPDDVRGPAYLECPARRRADGRPRVRSAGAPTRARNGHALARGVLGGLDHEPVVGAVGSDRLLPPSGAQVLDGEPAAGERAERAAGVDRGELAVVADQDELAARRLDVVEHRGRADVSRPCRPRRRRGRSGAGGVRRARVRRSAARG